MRRRSTDARSSRGRREFSRRASRERLRQSRDTKYGRSVRLSRRNATTQSSREKERDGVSERSIERKDARDIPRRVRSEAIIDTRDMPDGVLYSAM